MSNNIEKYNVSNYNLDGMIEDQSKFVRSTSCKLCNSAFRLECEELWEKTNNINAVYRLIESKGEKISYPAIRSHIINHYKKQENLDKLSNYVKSLDSWRKSKVEKEQRLELLMSILEKRIIEIAAEQDGNSDESGRKMADTMVKLIQQLLSCQSALDEHKQLMEPVKLIVCRLQAIVKEQIQTHSGKDVRSALINVVSSLEKDVHEIMKNGK